LAAATDPPLRIGVVGRGRLGGALARAARAAGHSVALLRRRGGAPSGDPSLEEVELGPGLDWGSFDLVLLAFGLHAESPEVLAADESLSALRAIPAETSVASVVMSMPTAWLDDFLPEHAIVHFLTTPAAELAGAIALLPARAHRPGDVLRLRTALPALHWIEAAEPDYLRLGALMVGSAIAAVSLAYLAEALGPAFGGSGVEATEADLAYLEAVLDDAKRLLRLHGGDGRRAFSSVATPGGFTERLHDRIFARPWRPKDGPGEPPRR